MEETKKEFTPRPERSERPQRGRRRRKVCAFCVDKVEHVDYKDAAKLRKYMSERGKILPRRMTGTCADLLFDLGGLAGAAAQVEQLGPAHLAVTDDLHLLNEGRVDGEHALHADAVGSAADGEGLGDAAVLLGDHSALEGLDALALAFLDANGDPNGVTDLELGPVLFDHALGDDLHCVH